MNNLMNFEGNNVEVFEFNGEILFNPYHVGDCLELARSTVRDNLRKMSSKQVIKLKNSNVGNTNFRKLHNTGENFITESGVYKLIFKSRSSKAEKFQDWVTDEVLPSIRKHGAYMTPETIEKILYDPDFISGLANELKKEQEKNKELEHEIEINQPKLNFYEDTMCGLGLTTTTQLAKMYGTDAITLNKVLALLGIQFKIGKSWVLYKKYDGKGYTEVKLGNNDKSSYYIMKWTDKGIEFVHNLLKPYLNCFGNLIDFYNIRGMVENENLKKEIKRLEKNRLECSKPKVVIEGIELEKKDYYSTSYIAKHVSYITPIELKFVMEQKGILEKDSSGKRYRLTSEYNYVFGENRKLIDIKNNHVGEEVIWNLTGVKSIIYTLKEEKYELKQVSA